MPARRSSPSRPGGPKSLHLLEATSRSARVGRCERRGRPPPPARVSGTAAGGPPGGRRAPQPRSDGRGGGGHSGSGSGAARSRGSQPSGPRPHPAAARAGGAPAGGGPRPPGSALREAAPSRGKAGGESRRARGGESGCSFASLVSFLKGFGDHASFPGAPEPLKAAQQGSDAKVIR